MVMKRVNVLIDQERREARIDELESLKIFVEAKAELGYNQMTEVLHELDDRLAQLKGGKD